VGVVIKEKVCEDEDVRLLMSLLGVDVCTALLLKSEIGSISRFVDYKRFVSWAGFVLRVYQLGGVLWNGGIIKCGSGILRWAIVEAVQTAVCYVGKFCGFYGRVKARCGGSKAIVAVGNKMLKIVWVMLVRRETYGGVNQRRCEEKLNSAGF
jgi:transposase